MLDRSTGAVLKTNGHIASVRPARGPSSSSSNQNNNNNNNANNNGNGSSGSSGNSNNNNNNNNNGSPFPSEAATGANSETLAAQELAAMIWSFLGTAGSLVGEVDAEVCVCVFLPSSSSSFFLSHFLFGFSSRGMSCRISCRFSVYQLTDSLFS